MHAFTFSPLQCCIRDWCKVLLGHGIPLMLGWWPLTLSAGVWMAFIDRSQSRREGGDRADVECEIPQGKCAAAKRGVRAKGRIPDTTNTTHCSFHGNVLHHWAVWDIKQDFWLWDHWQNKLLSCFWKNPIQNQNWDQICFWLNFHRLGISKGISEIIIYKIHDTNMTT